VKKKYNINKVKFLPPDIFNRVFEEILKKKEKNIEIIEEEEENLDLDDTEISKFLYEIFLAAKNRRASDIHITPKKNRTEIFFRIDGRMVFYNSCPRGYIDLISNKIKNEAESMVSYIKNKPQDGKLKKEIQGDILELRVSIMPSLFGENIVMRIAETTSLFKLKLDVLGFEAEDLATYRENYSKPYGMILNVGATGQGKTTTFYLTLQELFKKYPDKKFYTVEDPVEIVFEQATQILVNEDSGFTFSEALKALLRQDPDVILLGEIRDKPTADIAVKAAITGHLLFSTLHANDSLNAITRLRNLEVDDGLIASTLNCVLSQRLIRKLCNHCKIETEIDEEIAKKYGLSTNRIYKANPKGCKYCNYLGYSGRTAIVEVLNFDDTLKSLVSKHKNEIEIKHFLKEKGFNNLWKNGIKKVERGETSLEELLLSVNQDAILNNYI
jgi:type IV pilus assembly protein PilB